MQTRVRRKIKAKTHHLSQSHITQQIDSEDSKLSPFVMALMIRRSFKEDSSNEQRFTQSTISIGEFNCYDSSVESGCSARQDSVCSAVNSPCLQSQQINSPMYPHSRSLLEENIMKRTDKQVSSISFKMQNSKILKKRSSHE